MKPHVYFERKFRLLRKEFLTVLLLCWLQICKSNNQPPHIIFILVDDLGWNDVSFHGSNQIPTPNIDTLAADGIVLNNYYVQPICTPSRGALMTGKYPIHLGLQHDVIYAASSWGLPAKEKIMPQYLKDLEYITRGVGKWHLGFSQSAYLPTNRGFDSFFGFWAGKGDFYTHFKTTETMCGLDFHDDNETAWNYFGHYSTELFTEKSKDIIKNHNSFKPLFLYIAHQAPHTGNNYTPFQAPVEFVQRFSHIKDRDRREFAGMISALDFSIGEIVVALEQSGMLDNSIIVFSSDNGAAVEGIDCGTGSNWPLRGSKYTLWEGGMRTVGFVWSPLIRRHSRVSYDLMHVSDWLPTLYSAVGGDARDLNEMDGFNLWPSLCCNSPSPRQEILHNIDPLWNMESIRRHNYKLVRGRYPVGDFDGWFDKQGRKTTFPVAFTTDENLIYDLVYDQLMEESQIHRILLKKYSMYSENSTIAEHCKNFPTEDSTCRRKESFIPNSGTSNQCHIFQKEKLKINCGKMPKNMTENCKPDVAACLFDVENDPCEYNNLALSLPNVVRQLEGLLDNYRRNVSSPLFRPVDEVADPKYHGYAWIPWKT